MKPQWTGVFALAASAIAAVAMAHSGATGVVLERMNGMTAMRDTVAEPAPMMQGAAGERAFAGGFIRATILPSQPPETGNAPLGQLSRHLAEGRISASVHAVGSQMARLEIRFLPDGSSAPFGGSRPDVSFAMVQMHMDGIVPPLELVEAGHWRAVVQLPMAGRWVVNVGIDEDFAEVEFDVP